MFVPLVQVKPNGFECSAFEVAHVIISNITADVEGAADSDRTAHLQIRMTNKGHLCCCSSSPA